MVLLLYAISISLYIVCICMYDETTPTHNTHTSTRGGGHAPDRYSSYDVISTNGRHFIERSAIGVPVLEDEENQTLCGRSIGDPPSSSSSSSTQVKSHTTTSEKLASTVVDTVVPTNYIPTLTLYYIMLLRNVFFSSTGMTSRSSLLWRGMNVTKNLVPAMSSVQIPLNNNNNNNNSSRSYTTTTVTTRKMTIEDLGNQVDLNQQKVLVRVDLNVPLDKKDDMKVTDDTRLRAILPTVQYLLSKNAAVILCSHFGRPAGEIIESGKNGRLTPVVSPLQTLLGEHVKVTKLNDCIGPDVEQFVNTKLNGGDVCILENTRFYKGETKNDMVLAEGLGKLAKYFVMDAFGTAHRAHSSTAGVTTFMEYSVAGYCMEQELKFLQGAVFEHPIPPMVAIVGGAKVSTKIPVIESLITSTNTSSILIGGGMIFTFYKALGYSIGKSLVEEDMIDTAKRIMTLAAERNVQLLLPTDVVVADAFENTANTAIAKIGPNDRDGISDGWMGLDIGPETIATFERLLKTQANTIVWNGPMGVFEMSNFSQGTTAIAKILAEVTTAGNGKVITIIGGGDSVAAINQAGLSDQITHISTGGGASLELLEGKVLPGVAALTEMP